MKYYKLEAEKENGNIIISENNFRYLMNNIKYLEYKKLGLKTSIDNKFAIEHEERFRYFINQCVDLLER